MAVGKQWEMVWRMAHQGIYDFYVRRIIYNNLPMIKFYDFGLIFRSPAARILLR